MNLFNTLTSVLSPDVLARIATYIDESNERTSKAVNGLVYTIIGGLMKRTTSEIGVNQLYNHIQKGRYDGSLTDNLLTILREPNQTNTLITQGNDVISHLLPAMKSSIGNMISRYAGIRNSSSISLLGLITTIILHVLGKQVREKKLDADGLAALLFAERDTLMSTVPEEFMPQLIERLGLHQIISGVANPARRTSAESSGHSTMASGSSSTTTVRPPVNYADSDEDRESDNSSLAKWGVGALLFLAVAAGGYYVYQNTQKYSNGQEEVADVTVNTDTVQADTVTRSLALPKDSLAGTAPKSTSMASPTAVAGRPAATSVTAPAVAGGGLTQQMAPYLGNAALPKGKVFPLTGISFQPGSLSMTAGSVATIGELGTILKTYPRLQIQLVGYANDAQGDMTNKSLSFKRVNQIKQQLMASGVDYLRIDAIGRGTGVIRNDTSGIPKPTLRKIDVKVVVK
ncbi:hypothetical protein GCM10027592_32660 [Spirosoma flavus]